MFPIINGRVTALRGALAFAGDVVVELLRQYVERRAAETQQYKALQARVEQLKAQATAMEAALVDRWPRDAQARKLAS